MNYYLFEIERKSKFVRLQDPVDEYGIGVTHAFAEKLQNSSKAIAEILQKGIFPDRLKALGRQLILSKKADLLLRELKICHSIKRLELVIKSEKVSLPEPYWVYISQKEYDVLNEEESEFTYTPNGTILGLETPVLDRQKIPALDLFTIFRGNWVASQSLMTLFEKRKITGCEFTQLCII